METRTPHGRLWWDQGFDLGLSPIRIDRITQVRSGTLQMSRRKVLTVLVDGEWVAVNAPRSDVPALLEKGWWPESWPVPFDTVEAYTPWPEALD